MVVHECHICSPPNARETKRESREARSGYRITRPRGIRGWPACEDRDRTRAIERWGIPQDVDAKRERTSISRIPLNSNTQLSLSLAQHFLFETLFTHSRANIHLWPNIAKFLSFCTALNHLNISFSLYEFHYLHRNLTTNIHTYVLIYYIYLLCLFNTSNT
jgi:hypothetical protein